jgi:hypothetical protein
MLQMRSGKSYDNVRNWSSGIRGCNHDRIGQWSCYSVSA